MQVDLVAGLQKCISFFLFLVGHADTVIGISDSLYLDDKRLTFGLQAGRSGLNHLQNSGNFAAMLGGDHYVLGCLNWHAFGERRPVDGGQLAQSQGNISIHASGPPICVNRFSRISNG